MSERKKEQPKADQKSAKMPHSLIIENRKTLTATGVSNVEGFNGEAVVASTDLGNLTVRGSNLHIDKLNLETGDLTLDGEITSVAYTENRSSGGGAFSRLFK